MERIGLIPDLDSLPVDPNFTFICPMEPTQNLHQGRLARSVLTNQGNHFPWENGKINVIKENYTGEPLGEASHFNYRRLLIIIHNLISQKKLYPNSDREGSSCS